MADEPLPAPEGIPGVSEPGPFAVGRYAAQLRLYLRQRARVQLWGEVWNVRVTKARVYFELRDSVGAVPCAMWRTAFDVLGLDRDTLEDGTQVVVAGGPDYYVGGAAASPAFSFDVTGLRVAGEGDLLAQIEALRRTLDAEGLLERQKLLTRPGLPRTIGVVTGEGGKARDDVLAALHRRGWGGRLVWAFAPVQDRHAAPAITRALQDLAATPEIEVIVVARGGGSMADLLAFCDETLCRTVALLRVPVIASVGHHTDRPLIDDVAAERASTPTHAAEAAVPLHPGEERARLQRTATTLDRHSRAAVLDRARALGRLSGAPARHVQRERTRLHQRLRELRAAGTRQLAARRQGAGRYALVLDRKASAAAGPELADRRRGLDAALAALAGHDPERTLARGYALVEDTAGELVTTADAARAAHDVRLRFADDVVPATISDEEPTPT
jgi:exodeoxyribonuclease VII large subunit